MRANPVIPFMQLYGGTTFDTGVVTVPGDTVTPSIPTARTSTAITGVGANSAAWAMLDGTLLSIELDATNRGGGVLDATFIFERTVIIGSFRNPLAAGVVWTPVPTAEMGLDLIAAQIIQVQEFSFMASGAYRLNSTVHTTNGDLWGAIKAMRL